MQSKHKATSDNAGEPFDKAGGYGIQGAAATWVRSIEGCYFNICGFALHDFAIALTDIIEQKHLVLVTE